MYRVYWSQAAVAYSSLYSFFFLTIFQTLKIFVILFSGTVRTMKLKRGTHVDSGWMYHVYRNQALVAYFSFISPFFSLQFSNIKKCCRTFPTVRTTKLRLGTHVDSGWMYHAALAAYLSCYFFIFFTNFQTLKSFAALFSGTVWPTKMKLGTHVDNIPESSCCCLFMLYLFIFLSLPFSEM